MFHQSCFNTWQFPVSILPDGQWMGLEPTHASPSVHYLVLMGHFFGAPHPPLPFHLGLSAPSMAPFPLHASDLTIDPKCSHPSHPHVMEQWHWWHHATGTQAGSSRALPKPYLSNRKGN